MRRLLLTAAFALVPLAVLAVFFALPVGAMVGQGLVIDGRFTLSGVLETLGRERTVRVLWFTVWSAGAATLLSVLLGVGAAHALYRLRLPGRQVLRALLMVPFVLPTVVVGLAFRQLLGESGPLDWLGLADSPAGIVAALVFFNVTVVARTVGSAWERLDRSPAEAAAALGATPRQVFTTVTWPRLRPAVVSSASVVFLFCATSFGVVLTMGGLRYATVETEIYLLTVELYDLPAAAALSLLQLLVVTGLLLLAARTRRTEGAERGVPARPKPVTLRDGGSLAVLALTLLLTLGPVAVLVLGSLDGAASGSGGWSLAAYRELARSGSAGGEVTVPVTEALANSLRTAVDATWMSLLLGLVIATLVTRPSRSRAERRVRGVLDGLVMLPLGVSAVTLGFGFLIALGRPPLELRDSPLLVPIAQALVALPLVVRTLVPMLTRIDDRQRQAAASLGAPPWRVLATVDLPVIWRPLLAAGGFAFAVSLGEFGATSFLVRDDAPTMPVVMFRLLSHPGALGYQTALAAAVVLSAVIAVVVLATERLRVPGMGAF